MSDGIYSALSGAIAQERNLSVVANNLANSNTAGFKGDRTVFFEMVTTTPTAPKISPALRYATVADVTIDHLPGSFKLTERPLDVALHGDGYFVIETPKGERYTRAGSFVMDQEGVLRTLTGHRVMGENGPPTQRGSELTIPEDAHEVRIDPDGTLRAVRIDGGSTNDEELGKLKLVRFPTEDDLLKDGLTWFVPKEGVKPLSAELTTTVEQGFLEDSNVNAVSGMTELILVTRSFEALQKVIETFRDMDNRTARDVGGRV
jgi:flagellar basal-body rod protein FlgF